MRPVHELMQGAAPQRTGRPHSVKHRLSGRDGCQLVATPVQEQVQRHRLTLRLGRNVQRQAAWIEEI